MRIRISAFAAIVVFSIGLAAQSQPLRVGMIPDVGATQASVLEKAPLKAYLTKQLGREVEVVIPTSYNATVEAMGNGSLDFAYFGGLTYVKAHAMYGVIPLVQRTSDLEFHSLFIAGANSPIRSLADLKGRNFVFGDSNSTSGHLMPYYELKQAHIDVDKDLKTFRYSGSHPATAKAVESGAADAGALDESVFNAMIAEGKLDKARVRVFYTSRPFVDYVWAARPGVDPAIQEKFVQAFIRLKEGQDDEILRILRGKAFVRANDETYSVLRAVAQELKLL
ncbi:MAG: phosphate/phosphite/phosphonate ABC transporter substrate-binding protein [Acidobacteriia bacterium]|nr:phosphate/phosphite/phosphonate ABC transporter substrate-binding protein [Terriglobia bacterium]